MVYFRADVFAGQKKVAAVAAVITSGTVFFFIFKPYEF